MGGLKDGLKKLQDSAKELLDKTDIDDKIVGAAKDFLDKTDIDDKLAGAAKDLKEKAKAALEKTDMDDRIMDAAKGLKEKAQEAYEKARPGVEYAFNKASAGAKELFDKSIEGIKGPEKPKDAMEQIQDEVDEQVEIISRRRRRDRSYPRLLQQEGRSGNRQSGKQALGTRGGPADRGAGFYGKALVVIPHRQKAVVLP